MNNKIEEIRSQKERLEFDIQAEEVIYLYEMYKDKKNLRDSISDWHKTLIEKFDRDKKYLESNLTNISKDATYDNVSANYTFFEDKNSGIRVPFNEALNFRKGLDSDIAIIYSKLDTEFSVLNVDKLERGKDFIKDGIFSDIEASLAERKKTKIGIRLHNPSQTIENNKWDSHLSAADSEHEEFGALYDWDNFERDAQLAANADADVDVDADVDYDEYNAVLYGYGTPSDFKNNQPTEAKKNAMESFAKKKMLASEISPD